MKRGEMVTSVFHDYRVTRATDGLVVEVLDYHAGPLKLTHDRLAEFGFVPAQQGRPTPSKHMETGDELAVLADRAIDLLAFDR